MYLIVILLFKLLTMNVALAFTFPNEDEIRQNILQMQNDKNTQNQTMIIEKLQSALFYITESKVSSAKIKEYQEAINDFPILTRKLRNAQNNIEDQIIQINNKPSLQILNQQLVQVNNKLIKLTNLLQQEQDQEHIVSDSLSVLPYQQNEARKALNKVELELQVLSLPVTKLEQAQVTELSAKRIARQLKVNELYLAQLSANNRQELSRLKIELLRKRHDKASKKLQILRNKINELRQKEAKKSLEHTEMLIEQINPIPEDINNQLKINRELSRLLHNQNQQMDIIASKQRKSVSDTLRVRQALTTLREQAQWLNASPALGETLRVQISSLPDMPKPQQLNSDMAQLRVQRLRFEELMNKLSEINRYYNIRHNSLKLTLTQRRILTAQLHTQRNLLNALLTGCDTQILELSKLKIANSQLEEALKEIQEAAHRYLFWVADLNPINFSFPISINKDLHKLIISNTVNQLVHAGNMMFTSKDMFIPLLIFLLLIGFSISSRHQYYSFLKRSSERIGKVITDHFSLTLHNILWSILVAIPYPLFWIILGYCLQHICWPYPIAVAIGNGIITTAPILWMFIICSYFANSEGLFINHFHWSKFKVERIFKYNTIFTSLIILLMMLLITFNSYNNHYFISTIGRSCFILLCICLTLITNRFKHAGIILYLDKKGNINNSINRSLWYVIIFTPIIAALAACLGYLATAQALLARFETSIVICCFLLIVYYVIKRWMYIQYRRILFERSKQHYIERIETSINGKKELSENQINEIASEIDNKSINFDAIRIKSLKLISSILTLIALLSLILLWAELHSAFSFLENMTLWNINNSTQGVNDIQPITLEELLISILVFIITTQMVRNLPTLLELTLLQHLNLHPGSSYAITTLTKYILMLLGGVIGFSIIGIEWSKLRWLVAALGVGLGFGLQEIFANFISGLMILFEKPIRIGDTVTIRNLTGNITWINTRATTITDWDRKEIIVPNKAFITEQFVNWSLSDTITRIVLNIPAPVSADIKLIMNILLRSAHRCPLVLQVPTPEAFLIDLQQGLLLFELRMYAAEINHRMSLRHYVHIFILEEYLKHNIKLPIPLFQSYTHQIWSNDKLNSI